MPTWTFSRGLLGLSVVVFLDFQSWTREGNQRMSRSLYPPRSPLETGPAFA